MLAWQQEEHLTCENQP